MGGGIVEPINVGKYVAMVEVLANKNYEIILKDSSVNIINFSEIIDFSMNKISVRCDNKIINVEGKNLIISKNIIIKRALKRALFYVIGIYFYRQTKKCML